MWCVLQSTRTVPVIGYKIACVLYGRLAVLCSRIDVLKVAIPGLRINGLFCGNTFGRWQAEVGSVLKVGAGTESEALTGRKTQWNEICKHDTGDVQKCVCSPRLRGSAPNDKEGFTRVWLPLHVCL